MSHPENDPTRPTDDPTRAVPTEEPVEPLAGTPTSGVVWGGDHPGTGDFAPPPRPAAASGAPTSPGAGSAPVDPAEAPERTGPNVVAVILGLVAVVTAGLTLARELFGAGPDAGPPLAFVVGAALVGVGLVGLVRRGRAHHRPQRASGDAAAGGATAVTRD